MKKKNKFWRCFAGVLLLIVGVVIWLVLCLVWPFRSFLAERALLLGENEEVNYLVLLQNDYELRPGGGFISAYALVSFKDGKMNLEIRDSYSVDDLEEAPSSPLAIADLLRLEEWVFRDGNFAVDFAEGAEDVVDLFKEQSGYKGKIDGVFAVNFSFIEEIVELYDLEIGGQRLSEENVFGLLEYEVKNIDTHNVQALNERKDVLKDLGKEVLEEMMGSVARYFDLRDLVLQGLEEKDIQLYFVNEDLQELVEEKAWGGRFEGAGNFIYTNIANFGGRKGDRYLRKEHDYVADFRDERVKVDYRMNLSHFGGYNLHSDVYSAYARVFVPSGSELVEMTGEFYRRKRSFDEESGLWEFYLQLNPGESKEYAISYYLPEKWSKENFELQIVKQSGSDDRWTVVSQAPGDSALVLKEDGFKRRDNIGVWSEILKRDWLLDYEEVDDVLAPVVVSQRFLSYEVIEIIVSEEVDEAILEDLDNFLVRDLNYQNQRTEEVKVISAELNGKNKIRLFVEGVSGIRGERYALELRNLKDVSGNMADPNPLILTLVR